MKRENFKTRLGFLLVSAGCAIGIGNVWKFPYVTGQNGGGLFVLLYLLFLVIMGAPILTMELAVGRASRKSVVLGYRELEPKGSKWHVHGWFCILGCYMLMMYYTTVSGWMLNYMVKFATGAFHHMVGGESAQGVDQVTARVAAVFNSMLASPAQMLAFMAVTVVLGILVCSLGLQKGIEKVTKVMMTGLLVLIIVLAVHSLTLSRAGEGVKFYLLPDFQRAQEIGLGNVITAAMNQSFFTLSLGVAAMEIFGSYMSKDFSLGGEALRICGLDTFVALLSGLIIFPACFSYGVETGAGPSLIFITLPQVFLHMAGGRIWGTCFFLFMTFASFFTVIAVFENLIAAAMDNFGWSRGKSSLINFILIFITSIPCALGYNLWSNVKLIGGRDILDSEDFIVSNLLLPLGSLIFLLFCVTKWGWGFDKYREEANTGTGMKIAEGLKYYFRFVLPVLILIILIQGLL
ncbi:MAG: sodium-dependent transporter [Lachnospiraceae bacterium]|nr:sodium-dependent transporter [Lachnospiraceae bacterium]